jgi:hypothetical protein
MMSIADQGRQDGCGTVLLIMYASARQPPVDGTDISALAANRIAVTRCAHYRPTRDPAPNVR